MNIVYHIRERLRPRGGNSFYRDKSIRESSTFCGGAPTEYDIAWRGKAIKWTRPSDPRWISGPNNFFVPCEDCIAKRKDKTK